MEKFNNGAPYHGSSAVTGGSLRGATDATDYFYFFCPKCPEDEVVRILEYTIHAQEEDNRYNKKCKSKAKSGFTLVFKIHCEKCGNKDFVKVSNTGWQGGKHSNMLRGERQSEPTPD